MVYEQEIRTRDGAFSMRRITVELDEPTRDGDTVIHVLTNLPASVSAIAIAELYRLRWEVETGFYHVTTTLTCEVKSVGAPKAALFLFCVALMAFNIRQVVFAALYAEHPEETVNEISHFQVSVEVARYTDGMLVVLDDAAWQQLIPADPPAVAELMRRVSRAIRPSRYQKSRRGPKKKPQKEPRTRRKNHVSTAKILAAARN